MTSDVLKFSDRITCLPVIHGSGDFAVEVRRVMLNESFDCLAVPLPPSFQDAVEQAIPALPLITAVVQKPAGQSPFMDAADLDNDEDDDDDVVTYVPIDPCQPVIAALRIAQQERMPRAFIDLESQRFSEQHSALPDPYALKKVSVEQFAAAVLPAVPRPRGQLASDRIQVMAGRLRELETRFSSILFVCSVLDWPWIREAYKEWSSSSELPPEDEVSAPSVYRVEPQTLTFMLGELPHITGLYELARQDLDDDENLSVDGLKDLLLKARDVYRAELKSRARPITPKLLRTYFQYVRNLALIERRMTPDLYTLIIAAKQIGGDQFAISVAETARQYPFLGDLPFPTCQFGIGEVLLPDGDIPATESRLPGHPLSWRHCELNSRPPRDLQKEWTTRWNPYGQCSWPPEDVAIESFRTRVKDIALGMLGGDLARTEKFSSSLKDGLDMRETLRNWHTGDLYVKVFPPARGRIDCVVMLFDSPADPRDYPWRITWHAEHEDESTLSLFATDFGQEMVGPGIALATYGGGMFLFPPRPIPDVWKDPRFDFTDTLEERLIAAACFHSRERFVAILSAAPPGAGWRRLARRYGKKFVHVPLGRFSQATIQQLRMFHVLNGQQIRTYAAHFIRKA